MEMMQQYVNQCMNWFARGLGWGAGTAAGRRGANAAMDNMMKSSDQKKKEELDARQLKLENEERERKIAEQERLAAKRNELEQGYKAEPQAKLP